MTVLDPQYAATVTPQRLTTTAMGAETWTDLTTTRAVVSLKAATPTPDGGHHSGQLGLVFLPRGTAVRAGDRIPVNGVWFTVIGEPRGDQVHPFTGDDFGWIEYVIEGAL